MSTNAVFARGSEWSADLLYDPSAWGDEITEAQAVALGDLVRERFHQLCEEAGDPSIYWIPRTSEVIGHVYGQDTEEYSKWDSVHDADLDLGDLRNQAQAEVWEAGCGDQDSPVWTQVHEILESQE